MAICIKSLSGGYSVPLSIGHSQAIHSHFVIFFVNFSRSLISIESAERSGMTSVTHSLTEFWGTTVRGINKPQPGQINKPQIRRINNAPTPLSFQSKPHGASLRPLLLIGSAHYNCYILSGWTRPRKITFRYVLCLLHDYPHKVALPQSIHTHLAQTRPFPNERGDLLHINSAQDRRMSPRKISPFILLIPPPTHTTSPFTMSQPLCDICSLQVYNPALWVNPAFCHVS